MFSTQQLLRAGARLAVLTALLLSGCRAQATPTATQPPQTPQPTVVAASPTPQPTPTTPRKVLTICLGQEPSTLYLYGKSSAAQWNVLEAIYDGPIDTRDYASQPVILTKVPSLADKDALIQPVDVKPGDQVVDVNGNVVALAKGVKVAPSGCSGDGCSLPYDGQSPLKLDQVQVTFKLNASITWSDGKPLTAADSVYSYQLAADPSTPVSKYKTARTASYTAVDAQTTQWTGLPGFVDPDYAANFWIPLPQHAWGSLKPADLLTTAVSAEKPIGWGPYVIGDWAKGDHLNMVKNPHYAGAKDGLPRFDELVYRFLGTNSTANVDALLSGECDIVDQTAHLEDQLKTLGELSSAKKVQVIYGQGPVWEHLDFGIKPASYDDGYNPAAGDRPDFFGDARTRQAFADCIDRKSIVDTLLGGHSAVPDTFLPPGHPLLDANVAKYANNSPEGERLLDEVGWKDTDNNPATPRESKGVTGVPDGTQFAVNYLTTQAQLRKDAAAMIAKSLGACGIQVNVQTLAPGDLFLTGQQEGPLFGRKFDLAEFSWEASSRPACNLYTSARIPDAANHWVGENISGYSSQAFDQACQAAMTALPGQPGYADSQAKAQQIFSQDLPVIPLYLDVQVSAARPGVCGLTLDPTARSEFWNIENIGEGADCPK
jgi:peptide/nickel transport system substrate-binding protein